MRLKQMKITVMAAVAITLAACSPRAAHQALGAAAVRMDGYASGVNVSYNAFRQPRYVRLIDGGLDGPSVFVPVEAKNAVQVTGCKFISSEDEKHLTGEVMTRRCFIAYGDDPSWSKSHLWKPCAKADSRTWVCDPSWRRGG
jgi:hypothetical protein